MEYSFSDRVLELKPSAIREIFKYAADPEVISLSAGNPAPEAFPSKAIGEIAAQIFAQDPIGALQYSVTEGYPALRRHLLAYMQKTHQIGRAFDEILITSGAQQVMDLFTKSVCNEGDVILCEAPSFIGSLNTFRSYKARLCGIPMEEDGISLSGLEDALKREKHVKFLYTIPNFQNPSGITMSLEKRHGVYELAKKYGIMILEDNPYGDLRFAGEHIPAIKSFDEEGIVMYAGTFSKVISPGMRVGYAIGPKPILQKMIVCKQGEDVHTNILSQMICDEFMTKYDYDAHLAGLREIYRKKYALAEEALQKNLAPDVTWTPVEGGLFIWCTLPDAIDMPTFCKEAVLRKVCVVPGNAFLTNENDPCHAFRINFSTPTDEQLVRGIELLGTLLREKLGGKA